MDQERLAGVGNLLADEILWRAGVNPSRPVNTLTAAERPVLYAAVHDSVADALRHGGVHTLPLMAHRKLGGRCPRDGAELRLIAPEREFRYRPMSPDALFRPALERNHIQARFGQFPRHNRASPAEADNDNIDFLQSCDHAVLPQLRSATLSGSVGNSLSRYFMMFSRWCALTPGKPISFHPALLRLPP